MRPPMPLSTIVVGGGIGGLSLARELGRAELPVAVLERAPKLATVGAGIIMNPNAMAVLEANGLAECVRARSSPYLSRETFDQRGRRLAIRDYRPLYADGRLATGALCHRAHLHECLYDALPAGVVHLDARIVDLEESTDGVRVETESGQTFAGDVLIGADGIHSAVRTRFFGRSEPAYLGYRSHRFVVQNRDGLEHFTEFLGHGKRIGLVPIGGGQLYVWTTFNSPHESRAWALDDLTTWRALFAEFTDSRVRTALDGLESIDAVMCTDIEEVHQATWARGRVALLGDAAHALTPNMGQGAGMAMEDAAVLAQELARASRGDTDVPSALASYVTRRRPRVERIVRLSRQIGADGQLTGVLACWLRNRRIRREGRSPERMHAALERMLAWPRPATEAPGRQALAT
jgi:2-polyprenyl-6-methoxyphenol hydroxylase-like FAD-dependent oxidoreductase